jgi:L-fuconolactonase
VKRRDFMTLIGSAALPLSYAGYAQNALELLPVPRQAWLDRWKEPILEPDLAIIDPHHHLWVRPDWRYLLDDLLADTGSGHRIIATVFVQAVSMERDSGPVEMRPVGETEFINGVAAVCASGYCGKTRACSGIVGHADLRLGARVEPVLLALQRAGGDRFRGIRHITAYDADTSLNLAAWPGPPGLLADKTFREGFAQLHRHDLSFDSWIYHPQIHELADLAQAFPDTRIILNHVGGPLGAGPYRGKHDEVFKNWSASIKALSAHQNVFIKVGGLGQIVNGFGFNEHADPPSSATLASTIRPYVETCIEAFGSTRCMFESNFPVDKVSYSYAVYWNACKRLTQGASSSEKADLFAGTAARCYRLDLTA